MCVCMYIVYSLIYEHNFIRAARAKPELQACVQTALPPVALRVAVGNGFDSPTGNIHQTPTPAAAASAAAARLLH